MALHTVNVSVKGLFHNGMPFEGILRLKLSAPADGGENTLILPKEWQEIRFTPQGEAVAQLVPNALLDEGSYYQFEIVTTKNTGAYIYDKYGKKTTVERGVIVVPDRDCAFTEIVTLEPTQPEPLEASKAYASEAKEVLRETKEVAAGVAGSADKEIARIEKESETIREDALKAINEEGERVKGIVDDNVKTTSEAASVAIQARDEAVEAKGQAEGFAKDAGALVWRVGKTEEEIAQMRQQAYEAECDQYQRAYLGYTLEGDTAKAESAKQAYLRAKAEVRKRLPYGDTVEGGE